MKIHIYLYEKNKREPFSYGTVKMFNLFDANDIASSTNEEIKKSIIENTPFLLSPALSTLILRGNKIPRNIFILI